ncbi:alpha/beta fold hydrolase [Aeromicrobium terrae]|uniref:Alpha/beta hydrolase n=1 Tax=Aeromicrobium terrae TaxID=2498846 RepID=A0A5C8NI75_9ACTN|nr:alpha/beta hydrolase [Aeromicrobium terrae]TXL58094.1 alpha/beta hydrolase [Aeromicrobium terrae]
MARRASTRLAATAGAFVAAGVATKVLSDQQAKRRRLKRGEDVEFGSVHSPTRSVISADGSRINVEIDDADSPITVVFVHGILCSIDAWHYQRLALRGSVRMVFMDQRSHGRSGASNRAGSTTENLANDLRAVIQQCTSGPVLVVGHSLGGMTTMSLAAHHPDLFGDPIVGVVLLATSTGKLFVSSPSLRRLVGVSRALAPAVTWGRAFNSYSVVRRWAVGPDAPAKYADMTNEMISRTPTRILTDFHPMLASLDLRDAFKVLSTVPTVVVCGTHDAITPLSHSRRIAAGVEGSNLVILERTGHMVMFEEHVRVTEIIQEMVEKVAP